MSEYTPSEDDMRGQYVAKRMHDGATRTHAEQEYRRWLIAHDARVCEEQREIDLAMHHAYRPEAVAEIAVCLDDDVDWDRIATWCGARIETTQDPSGEYTSVLVLGNRDVAARGMWIVKRLDGTYSVRAEVADPDASTLARVRRDAAREALDGLADEANHVDWEMDGPSFALRVRRFKNRKYPEVTP